MLIILIALAIIVVVVIWWICTGNRFRTLNVKIDETEGSADVFLDLNPITSAIGGVK